MNIEIINKKLNKKVKKYSFPQAIRIISYFLKKIYPEEEHSKLYKRIYFKGNASLTFQKSEILEMLFLKNKEYGTKVEITLNFLALFGSSSPLPGPYNEMALRSKKSDKILHDLLSLFNHNLQKFIYPIWEKQRYYIQYKKDLKDKFSKYMLSLLGLYANLGSSSNKVNFHKIMPYIGVLSMRQKSAGTLVTILRHYLDFENVEIIQCIKMQSKIPKWQYLQLGSKNSVLGEDTMIGKFIINKSSKFRILLRNVESSDMYKYSIHGSKMNELNDLISFAFNEPLDYDVCMSIKKENKTKFYLSNENKQYLGINSWIGESLFDEEIIIAQKG